MNLNKRTGELLRALNLKQFEFAEKIGVSPQAISRLIREEDYNAGVKLITAILEGVPNLNAYWFLLDRGEMFNKESSSDENKKREDSAVQAKIEAFKEFLEMERENVLDKEKEIWELQQLLQKKEERIVEVQLERNEARERVQELEKQLDGALATIAKLQKG